MKHLGIALLVSMSVVACSSDDTGLSVSSFEDSQISSGEWSASRSIVLDGRGDEADVYYPAPPASVRDEFEDRFPIAVVLQGGRVDKAHYSNFGAALARMGFVVVVPNHMQAFPPGSEPWLLTDQFVLLDVLSHMERVDSDPSSEFYKIVDTQRVGLVGHSVGGAVGLYTAQGTCDPPFCMGAFERPASLRAGVFFGTNSYGPDGSFIDFETSALPVALIHGSLDNSAEVRETYDSLDGTRALITLDGVNHFGITNENNPSGPTPDPAEPTMEQHEATELTALWVGVALRTWVMGDEDARFWLYESGGSPSELVSTTAEDRP